MLCEAWEDSSRIADSEEEPSVNEGASNNNSHDAIGKLQMPKVNVVVTRVSTKTGVRIC